MATKKTSYNSKGIENIPKDKPVVYRIKTAGGNDNYIGVAKRGRSQDRIAEHLNEIPGATVQIEQMKSINDAREKEERLIKRNKPKYNKQGK